MQFLICKHFLVITLLLSSFSRSEAGHPNCQPKIDPVALPLHGMKMVPISGITKSGTVISPREDDVWPEVLQELLGKEEIRRLTFEFRFELKDGYPEWAWESWRYNQFHIKALESNDREVRQAGIEHHANWIDARLRRLGFRKLKSPPVSEEKNSRYSAYYQASYEHRTVTIAVHRLSNGVIGNFPFKCIVRGTHQVEVPSYSQVVSASSFLQPFREGRYSVPVSVIDLLQDIPVGRIDSMCTLHGSRRYSLSTKKSSLDLERWEQALKKAEFEKRTTILFSGKVDKRELLYYEKRAPRFEDGRLPECRVHVYAETPDSDLVTVTVIVSP